MRRAFWLGFLLLAGLACGGEEETAPSLGRQRTALRPERELKVLTQNLYLGANLEPLFGVTSVAQLPAIVSQLYAQVVASDFPGRAQALADEIARSRPHLIGLQEAELIRVQQPGDFFLGNPQPAQTVVADYAAILVAALLQRGLEYRVVVAQEGTDIEAPAADGSDVRITDREVLLARADVTTSGAFAATFAANASIQIGGPTGPSVQLRRGWVQANASIEDALVHVASTHLESAPVPFLAQLQAAQAAQLLGALAAQPLPVVLMGDFNSAADGSSTPTYQLILGAGFADAWALSHPGARGETCCQSPDLSNVASELVERIDYVFLAPGTASSAGLALDDVKARLVAAQPAARTDSGLWPSDHAGVEAWIGFDSGPSVSR